MYFHKFPFPSNFEFLQMPKPGDIFHTRKGAYKFSVDGGSSDIYRLEVSGKEWQRNESLAKLYFKKSRRKNLEAGRTSLLLNEKDCSFRIKDRAGNCLLESLPGRLFGQCGTASIFEFVREKDDHFYGMGEKWTGLEHSEKTTKFWNTDVWGDFSPESYIQGRPVPDPVYVSIPYLIIKRGNTYIGLLLHNPYATFISTGFKTSIAGQMDVSPSGNEFAAVVTKEAERAGPKKAVHGLIHLGAEEGQPCLYIIVGPSLPELTKKTQKLMGVTPRPPAWALGYHQCRWGYESEKDLVWLDENFRKHQIPVDGLWLDIDYMRGYRVFTFDKNHFPDPSAAMRKLSAAGRRIVPIIDPGVKREATYSVFQRGKKTDSFCRNSQGDDYVGLVWPGETVFPDFSLPTARKWWADEVRAFAKNGIHAAWLDMNDPSTGPADNTEMLFGRGKKSHASFHNQYALGMAIATREGFQRSRPNERPFLLSRSGCIGSNRYTAIWTGDNYSNYHHLKTGVSTTLNLALSGIPFNGPDSGGFGGDVTPELMRDWFKACFLFPIFRNHSLRHTRQQEPWAFDGQTNEVLRRYIRLRYRLRPYLYQLFVEHERTGDAILRPLFYDFADTRELPLAFVDDQFMVGPSVMQAPFLEEGQAKRKVVLPGEEAWYDLTQGAWVSGAINVAADFAATPLFVRNNTILPLARISSSDHIYRGTHTDFHIYIESEGEASICYQVDDAISYDYVRGAFSEWKIKAHKNKHILEIEIEQTAQEFEKAEFAFTTLPDVRSVKINGKRAKKIRKQGINIGINDVITWSL